MSSVTADKGSNRQSVYAATKAAIQELCKYYNENYAGVRFNAIVSGAVETELLEQLKIESPGLEERMKTYYPLGIISMDKICDLIDFLLSDDSMFFAGTAFPIDSGYLL